MTTPVTLQTVAVVGNGLMGHGIAQIFAAVGMQVRLIGRREESLAAAMGRIRQSLEGFQAHDLVTAAEADAALGLITTSTSIESAADAELVIEAVPAVRALQHEIFGSLDSVCPVPAILASTSGQPASQLVERVTHRGRVVAAHFWYPAQLIPVVEVCAGPETEPDVVPWLCNALTAAGKEPAVVEREVNGFIGNRIQFAMLREAWSMWASGVATAEAIDSVVRNSLGRRLAITGPIESADMGGLDTLHVFAEFLLPDLDTRSGPDPKVTELVGAGHRGLLSGKGVYDWSERDGEGLLAARMAELFRHMQRES